MEELLSSGKRLREKGGKRNDRKLRRNIGTCGSEDVSKFRNRQNEQSKG